MLKVVDLSLSFGAKKVLQRITFECQAGEIVVVMGSSGGGKTTLLKCIAGLLQPTSGDILVNDLSVIKNLDKVRPHMGLVFQYAALFDFLNVKDNILFGLRRQKRMGHKEENELVKTLLSDVGLEGVEDQMPDQLSGGMKKRVGLARALALAPDLILYDEPTSGLDPITAYSIDQLIVKTREQKKITSVVVSHDVTSILRVADKIAFLHEGNLNFWGTPADFRSSENADVRELVGKSQAQSLQAPV